MNTLSKILELQNSSASTEVELYHGLIKEAMFKAQRNISEALEQYLVRIFLMSSLSPDVQMTEPEKRLATLFLEASNTGSLLEQGMVLHELGYEGIKLLGLFPKHIQRRHVTMSYVYDMTYAAYDNISQLNFDCIRSSTLLQAMVPLSAEITHSLSDLIVVLWHTRQNNELLTTDLFLHPEPLM